VQVSGESGGNDLKQLVFITMPLYILSLLGKWQTESSMI
jgi:hypothetical protein